MLKDQQKEAAAVYLLWPKDVVVILPTGFEESDILALHNGKRNTNGANVVVFIVLLPKSIVKEQIKEMEEDSFHCFVNKGQHASADCQRSEIQACFQRTAEDFLDAKHHPRMKTVSYN